jgi:hypothetical protein
MENLFVAVSDKYCEAPFIPLHIEVWDWDLVSKNDFEGSADLKLDMNILKTTEGPTKASVPLEPLGGTISFAYEYKTDLYFEGPSTNEMKWNKEEQKEEVYRKRAESLFISAKDGSGKHIVTFTEEGKTEKLIFVNTWHQVEKTDEGVVIELTINWQESECFSHNEEVNKYQILVHGGLKNATKISFFAGREDKRFRTAMPRK